MGVIVVDQILLYSELPFGLNTDIIPLLSQHFLRRPLLHIETSLRNKKCQSATEHKHCGACLNKKLSPRT